jgi:hypothetical protein
MNQIKSTLLIAAMIASVLPAMAQQRRVSPHETISAVIDGNRITVVYGRPYTKNPRGGEDRKIWGTLVPYGKVWRMGADEATLLVTQKAIMVGETAVPAGVYTLYMMPDESGASNLIINKQVGQWGTQYSEGEDLGRVELKKEALEKAADQLTLAIEKNPTGGGVLKVMWESTQFSVPITVKK